ncbi:MAG: M56 family metallopeptidase [Clostridiaceae bacterium]|nr:M56 family metallopeptidase [Clostridiaceae bacterium]
MILLPNLDYSDEELYYILKHEYTHFLSYDILMKQVVMIFCMLFWWNPAVYLLKRDFDQAVEIKCDTFVTKKMSKAERTAYLKAILSSLHNQKSTAGMPYVSTSLSKDDEFIKARFNAVMGQKKSKRYYIMNACVIICYTLIILFSYLTILQPQIAAPDVTGPGDVEFDSENSYILHTNDGEYWLVIDDTQQYMIGEDVANICKNSGFVIIEE